MIVTAPIEGFIERIATVTGGQVAAGDALFLVHNYAIEKEILLSRLKLDIAQWKLAVLKDKLVSDRIATLREVVRFNEMIVGAHRLVVAGVTERRKLNDVEPQKEFDALKALEVEENRLDVARSELISSPMRVRIKRKVAERDIERIEIDIAEWERLQRIGNVESPVNGRVVRMFSGEGAFVEVGDPILELAE